MKTKLTLLTLLILVASCSSERKCRRAIAKAEKLGCLKTDSVTIYDTLILTNYDTMVQFKDTNEVDTLFIDNGGIKTVVFTKWKTKEVRVTQKADTIIKERKVPQIQVKQLDCPKQKWWDKAWLGFVAGIVLFLLLMCYIEGKFSLK